MQRTTIAVSPRVRDRLRSYGRKDMTYDQILQELMDRTPRNSLLEDPAYTYTREFTNAEVRAIRAQSAGDRLRLAEQARRLAEATNPEGTRRELQRRKNRFYP